MEWTPKHIDQAHSIRGMTMLPYWEIKQALQATGGDVSLAVAQLRHAYPRPSWNDKRVIEEALKVA